MHKPEYFIKENSWVAAIAAKKLKVSSVAIVIGKTIHLHGSSEKSFLQDEKWLRHECCHVQQFKEHGFLSFIAKYLWESIRKGYYANKYEAQARAAENEAGTAVSKG